MTGETDLEGQNPKALEQGGIPPSVLALLSDTADRMGALPITLDLSVEQGAVTIWHDLKAGTARMNGDKIIASEDMFAQVHVVGALYIMKDGEYSEKGLTAGISAVTVLKDPAVPHPLILIVEQIGRETLSVKLLRTKGLTYDAIAAAYSSGSVVKNDQLDHIEQVEIRNGVAETSGKNTEFFPVKDGARVDELSDVARRILAPIGKAAMEALARHGLKAIPEGDTPELTA